MAAHAGMGRRRGRGDRGCRLRLRRSAGLLEKADLAVIALRARMQRNAKAIERLLQHDLTALGMALVEQLPCRRMPQSLGDGVAQIVRDRQSVVSGKSVSGRVDIGGRS